MVNIDIERIKRLESSELPLPEFQKEALNIIETQHGVIMVQAEQIQELEDEINRLKGEKGRPQFKPNPPKPEPPKADIEATPKKPWKKSSKTGKIKIDREETVHLDKTGLPDDLEFKGYEEKIIQNIVIQTDNVLYRVERWYSPSTGMTYTAQLDESLQGTSFGPDLKALVSYLYYEHRVTENKIASFLSGFGIFISEGTISNILIKEEAEQLTEKTKSIIEAGLSSETYNQIDDTGMKIDHKNGYATILCNKLCSAFFINTSKSRETIRSFLTAYLLSLFIVLVCDDAPQFKGLAQRLMLCWVHEERHYKKMNPVLEVHKQELERIRRQIWDYYKKLADYKENPTEQKKAWLWDEFDLIFNQETVYDDLNQRLALTFAKKDELLTVLDYPEVPLHNNLSENGVREMVIKRKISGGVKTEEGIKAWENNMSISATCKKLGVSFYAYMVDVFSKNNTIDLPAMIRSKSSREARCKA